MVGPGASDRIRPVNGHASVDAPVLRRADRFAAGVDRLEAHRHPRPGGSLLDRDHARRRHQMISSAWRSVDPRVVGGVDAAHADALRQRACPQRQGYRPLVADGEDGVSRGPRVLRGVVVARVGLAEARGVGHQPPRIDLMRDGADPDADEGARELHVAVRGAAVGEPSESDEWSGPGLPTPVLAGKFIASTNTSWKSGCVASDTCSIERAMRSARARSASETRHIWAPSEAALP